MTITEKLRALVVEAGQYGDLSACVKCADLLTLIEIVEAAEAYRYLCHTDGRSADVTICARDGLDAALAKNRGAE